MRISCTKLLPLALPLVLLTGCAPGALAPAEPSTSASASATTSDAPSPSPEPTASGEPTVAPTTEPIADGTELDLSCESVFSLDQLYAYNANFLYVPATTLAMPTVMERAPELGGIVCAAQHESSDETLFIGVAAPNEAAKAELSSIPAFSVADGFGTASSLGATYWVTVASQDFESAADAQPVLDQVIANLG